MTSTQAKQQPDLMPLGTPTVAERIERAGDAHARLTLQQLALVRADPYVEDKRRRASEAAHRMAATFVADPARQASIDASSRADAAYADAFYYAAQTVAPVQHPLPADVHVGTPQPLYHHPHVTRASVSVSGRSSWGYEVHCTGCGTRHTVTTGSSVSYEDGPPRFARAHAACANAGASKEEK